MTDQDQRFQHRWQFRRTEIDVDSSSDEDHSRPSSASEPKVVKQKLVPFSDPEDNANQTVHSPTSCAKEEKENISSIKEPNSKQKQPGKTHERKAKTRTKKATSNTEPNNGGALSDLKGHMVSLVEDIKNARMDLLKWMDNELKSSSSKVNTVSTKPSGTKKGQRQNTTRGKTQRSNPNNRRKKSGKVTQNGEGEASGKKSSPINEEVVVPSKETENVVITTIPVENTEKQKGKRPRLSAKKQKTAVVEADQQSNTTVAAAADNYLTLPSVLPQKQAENNERNPLNDGNEIDGEKRNTLNSGGSSSSYQVNFDPRAQQKDVVFAQNSMPRPKPKHW